MYEVNDGVGWITIYEMEWKSMKIWPAIHDMCYSIAERHQTLNSGMEMRWMKYGMK